MDYDRVLFCEVESVSIYALFVGVCGLRYCILVP